MGWTIGIIVGIALLALVLFFVFTYWGKGTGWFGGLAETVDTQVTTVG